jgi:hypothetical protein
MLTSLQAEYEPLLAWNILKLRRMLVWSWSIVFYAPCASSQAGSLISFYCTTSFTNSSLPTMFALTTRNVAGHENRTTASAIHFGRQWVAFIVGRQLFLNMEAPQ